MLDRKGAEPSFESSTQFRHEGLRSMLAFRVAKYDYSLSSSLIE